MTLLQTAGWIACVIYATIPSFWLIIHPWAEVWRSTKRSPYRAILPLWVGMWLLLGLVSRPRRHVLLYSTPWAWAPAVLLFLLGLWTYSQAGKDFSAKQLGGLPELLPGHKEQRLVISGIRQHVRHPVYLGHLCELLAWSIGTGLLVCYGLTAFALVSGAVMIRTEDRELEARFGQEYAAYKKSVPAIVPR